MSPTLATNIILFPFLTVQTLKTRLFYVFPSIPKYPPNTSQRIKTKQAPITMSLPPDFSGFVPFLESVSFSYCRGFCWLVHWFICLNKQILLSPGNILELNRCGRDGFVSVVSGCWQNPRLPGSLGTRKQQMVQGTAETGCAAVRVHVRHLRLQDLNESARVLWVVRSLTGWAHAAPSPLL